MFDPKGAEIFKNNILYCINNSGLQVGLAYYILKDVLHELEKVYLLSMEETNSSSESIETETISMPIPNIEEIDMSNK